MMRHVLPFAPFAFALILAACGRTAFLIGVEDGGGGASVTASGGTAMGGAGGTGGAPLCVPGAVQSCYSGPSGTEGQGICKAGTHTCMADGASWGTCEGEVLPKPEDCATPFDEDCDGMAPACEGNVLWAKRFGDADAQTAKGIAVDGSGNAIVTGSFWGAIDFGGGVLQSAGDEDVFLVKLDGGGEHLWSRGFGGAGSQLATSIAVDSAGAVVIAGHFTGAVDFGGSPLVGQGGNDIFLAKIDAAGEHVWSKQFGDPFPQFANAVAIDGNGNIIFTGSFYGEVDFGGGSLQDASNGSLFVAKLDGAGNHLWSKSFGNAAGLAVAVDGSGNVVVGGTLNGTATFGNSVLVDAGGGDAFVAKLDGGDGHPLWSARYGDESPQSVKGVAVEADGATLLTGNLNGTASFGDPADLMSAGGADVFITKRDLAGNQDWGARFGDSQDQTARCIAVDAWGNVIIAGEFAGEMDLGGGSLQSAGSADVFVAKLTASGEHRWSRRYGDSAAQSALAVAVDGQGNVLVAGYFTGTMVLGSSQLVSAGGSDVFVAKLSP